ncbi:MAG: hypothetical protein H0X65_06915 [Gemmatimonadetes bacterium]|nr:hypothetical protein [Gemmatimonadota bacterium]
MSEQNKSEQASRHPEDGHTPRPVVWWGRLWLPVPGSTMRRGIYQSADSEQVLEEAAQVRAQRPRKEGGTT